MTRLERSAFAPTSTRVLTLAVATAVAVAFADSSIVVLALPELYVELGTSISGITWVITSYNVVVAVGAFVLLPFAGRLRTAHLMWAGLLVFLASSVACALSDGLTPLMAARSGQGLGGVLVLVGALPLLAGLTGTSSRAAVVWTLAGTLGAALGPALGGVLTEVFSWRAIFVAQVPLVGVALLATFGSHVGRIPPEPAIAGRPSPAAQLGIGLVFGALVGALFLAVLMLVAVWELTPLVAAGVVSALPVATLAARPLAARLAPRRAALAGAAALALGLVDLALLPATSKAIATLALAVCGLGLGLAVPVLSHATISPEHGLTRSSAWSIGSRHAGLVLALVLIAPLLAYELDRGSDTAALAGAAIVLDAPLPVTTKVPVAIGLRDALHQAQRGEIPDLERVFEAEGAGTDQGVAQARDRLLGAIQDSLTRSFRSSYGLAALLAALAILPTLAIKRLERW